MWAVFLLVDLGNPTSYCKSNFKRGLNYFHCVSSELLRPIQAWITQSLTINSSGSYKQHIIFVLCAYRFSVYIMYNFDPKEFLIQTDHKFTTKMLIINGDSRHLRFYYNVILALFYHLKFAINDTRTKYYIIGHFHQHFGFIIAMYQ